MREHGGRLGLRDLDDAVFGFDRERLVGLHRLAVLALGELAGGEQRLGCLVLLVRPQLLLLGPNIGSLACDGAALRLGLPDLVFRCGPALWVLRGLELAGLRLEGVLTQVGDLGARLLGDLAIDVREIVGVFVGLVVVELIELLDHLHVGRHRLDLLRRWLGFGCWLRLGLRFGLRLRDLGLRFGLRLDQLELGLLFGLGLFRLGLRLGLFRLRWRLGLGQLDDQQLLVVGLERLGLEQRHRTSEHDEVGPEREQQQPDRHCDRYASPARRQLLRDPMGHASP